MSDVDPVALEWLDRYAAALGRPGAQPRGGRGAACPWPGTAAHASHRQAAPVACWLAAQAGLTPGDALERAKALPS